MQTFTVSYVKGVYKSYIDNKRKQGENDEEVSKKLKYLQLRVSFQQHSGGKRARRARRNAKPQFPHFDKLADEVRENAGLPKTPN